MTIQYHQREHSFGIHVQLRLEWVTPEEAQDCLDWCHANLPIHSWDHQVMDMNGQTYLQVDTVNPDAAMLIKLTWA